MADLRALLAAGLCIIEPTENVSHDLESVLASRLTQYYACLGQDTVLNGSETLESLKFTTAAEALNLIERIHGVLEIEDAPVGTRDLAELRTLVAIAFKWGVDPLLARAMLAWPSKAERAGAHIIDLTNVPEDFKLLCSMVFRLLNMTISPTFITATLLNRHLDQLLRPCIAIGWLPKAHASDPVPESIKPGTIRLLESLPPSQTITALGAVLSVRPCPRHVHKSCTFLLSKQLLRPDGVRGLCAAVFGEDSDEIQLEKLEHVARVLTTPPAGMSAELYFSTVTPKILELLSERAPASYRRAAAFSVSRMLTTPTSSVVLSFLHPPFLAVNSASSPRVVLTTIMTLVTNTDPSPTLISSLLSPIVSALYSLLYNLDQVKTSDPSLKETLRGLLGTWGRVVGAMEGLAILWSVIDGQGGEWRVDLEGQITRLDKSEKPAMLSLLTPADDEEIDFDSNILDLYPDPAHFVRFLKSIQRTDICSDLFVRLLEFYRDSKAETENDPTRTLLYLQLVVQMQTQLSDGPSTILGKPAHILSFVKHALEPERPELKTKPADTNPFKFNVETSDDADEGDSDDDTPGADIIGPDDEMIETSVNLLLAVLEANEDLSARTAPVLNEIFSLLEPLSISGSTTLRPLAREARMVMTARLASTSAPKRSAREEDDTQEIYQRALKLLQDPILPVRAHGLLLLRQLVTPQKASGSKISDPALIPAILSIFLQSVHDDDSYMFLNAVQGLAAMVDAYGKDVLKGLMREYSQGLDGLGASSMTRHDMDVRIRIGEALASVIKRCGSALPAFIDILVPPLFHVVRSSQFPTTIRTSAISLLAECENTCSVALIPYVTDLSEAMVDLLQIETSSTTLAESEDSNPTSANSKLPSFRRAALHFLGLLIRETTRQVYDSYSESGMVFKRIRTTLAYISATDSDTVVRVMAREAVEALSELENAMIHR
ncbi:RTP1-C1 domain-containing protein [Mycena sanguinolenta]|uniref:RTP1-C1 domain-containing protein n=1 Tax=Mycena sanguinolenta TaxID=230812 RepID=A0A8H6YBD4_9AGAR|nr:RTP1-C1 domain-containing protein [Mycena sanguinolenta]